MDIVRPTVAMAIVVLEMLVIGAIDDRGWVVSRAVFDFLTIDVEIHQSLSPIDLARRPRRDQHLPSEPPVFRINGKIADAPIGVLKKEVRDITDLLVAGVDNQ